MLVIATLPFLFIVVGILLAELPTGRLQKYGIPLVTAGLIGLVFIFGNRSITLGD